MGFGIIFALTQNVPLLRYIEALGKADLPGGIYPVLEPAVASQAALVGITLPTTPAQARQPQPIIRPLVLRARQGERLIVTLTNEIRPKPGKNRDVGIHLVGGGYDVRSDDGSDVGQNPSYLVPYGGSRVYEWHCEHEGVFVFHDGGNYSGDEDGTNVHGLFGALIVEPPGTKWRDPVTGRVSHGPGGFTQLDGLYLDVMPESFDHAEPLDPGPEPEGHTWPEPVAYFNFAAVAHREFVIVFHDEPEFVPPHGELEPDPCDTDGHGGHSATGRHGGGHNAGMPIMPVSYRAEPMINRERRLWKQMESGPALIRPVLNEEQHHSSWMFGDPATPILKAYIGDPVRIRFVHAGVKETHVFHLHLYEWHAAAGNPASPRIDAISVSPQTAHTIEPVWGAGNRHQVAGDIIWHCHLYPHFHEGMWGMFRTFETRQHGIAGALLDTADPIYAGRKIGLYPDGTLIEKLLPLPNRPLPPRATPRHPGYPLYIPGAVQQKSPIPPWPDRQVQIDEALPPYVTSLLAANMPPDFDYRPQPTDLERAAFNARPVPGELFTRNPIGMQQEAIYSYDPATDTGTVAEKGERTKERDAFLRNSAREVAHDIAVVMRDITYNSHRWHDKHGHLYYLEADGDPALRAGPMEPLFFRAQHGQVVNVILRNATPRTIPETEFDHAFPPCPARPWEGECATHVHMVKIDPICADGAATGWNYMSGARHGKRMVYRWWADQEFGTIFFHDHMFANHRQKHGLFGALLVEPAGSKFFHNVNPGQGIISGVQARIERHKQDPIRLQGPHGQGWFREFCIGIGDFMPMWAPVDHGAGDQAL